MRNHVRIEVPLVLVLFLTAGAMMVVGNVFPQSTQVNGKVTLKQADGTEVPAGQLGSGVQVSLNGTNAISGATVFSDSTVTTAKGSSAVVSLGKLGRVEVFPETTMKLSFTDSSITVMLDAGRVRLSSSSGVNATVTTKDGQVIANGSKKNEFTVDTTCGNTWVSVKKGRVELRAGDTVKQIAAGNQDTAGQARPGCTPAPR
jgi:ferric-dicitrate binding protein FerR (iron transport regulator)